MSATLDWLIEDSALVLKGELTRQTLLPLWQVIDDKQEFNCIRVNELAHVDSAGLALLVRLLNRSGTTENKVLLVGMTEQLNTLVKLYNLQDVLA